MFCVGLTGRIASGKTTVAKLFQHLGVAIISADQINHELLQIGEPSYNAIVAHFPSEVLLHDGHINKDFLREVLIEDPKEKSWLEALLHPQIKKLIKEKVTQLSSCDSDSQTNAYCLIEIPLLIQHRDYPYLDRILLIDIDEETQLARLKSRNTASTEQNKAFIAMQASREAYQQTADDIILNRGNLKQLLKKIEKLHIQYLQFSRQKSL